MHVIKELKLNYQTTQTVNHLSRVTHIILIYYDNISWKMMYFMLIIPNNCTWQYAYNTEAKHIVYSKQILYKKTLSESCCHQNIITRHDTVRIQYYTNSSTAEKVPTPGV